MHNVYCTLQCHYSQYSHRNFTAIYKKTIQAESTIYTMGKKLQKYFLERVRERMPALSGFMDQCMEEQAKYLEENPLDPEVLGKKDCFVSNVILT